MRNRLFIGLGVISKHEPFIDTLCPLRQIQSAYPQFPPQSLGLDRAKSPIVSIPLDSKYFWVTGPTPQNRPIGNG